MLHSWEDHGQLGSMVEVAKLKLRDISLEGWLP